MSNTRIKELAETVAQVHFEHTLKVQNSDWLDFFEVSVWSLERALLDMYALWQKEANSKK